MSAFENLIYREVRRHYSRTRKPVKTMLIADLLGKNDRMVRKVLTRLEDRGVVQRWGQRGGWMPRAA